MLDNLLFWKGVSAFWAGEQLHVIGGRLVIFLEAAVHFADGIAEDRLKSHVLRVIHPYSAAYKPCRKQAVSHRPRDGRSSQSERVPIAMDDYRARFYRTNILR